MLSPTEKDILEASYDFTEAEGFRHGARWAIDQCADPQLLTEVSRLQSLNADLVRRLEKDIQRIEQLCNMANNLAGNLGLGRKVNADNFTANARCGIKLAKGE